MAKLLNIVYHPNPILRKKSEEIDINDLKSGKLQQLLLDMERTMKEKDGAGLAAPQIGKNIRLVVISHNDKTLFLINPKITKKSWAKETEEEGCLSVVNKKGEIVFAPVKRHKKVNFTYFDAKGKKKTLTAEKMLARAVQHEIDHLNGILFIDYLENLPAGIEAESNN
ncbi:MAG: peptide deformylase [Patescibacteria group bacterium]|jgi:peptide deformylase|nr:peptide deformylase [Patescibacteria group bacterium]MDD3777857.1 peptide deformylase [Patescibacteria group bacterium]MDD3939357.1 peptide deformylase [Patescibacteria group bacterium]MDD4443996.1 peptide deformylase [Patescibacteria group bacterium]NCU39439.1 peptide deformylase [Candidatus Falkowbacteria bacterium]